jgi:hypothetical protein
MADAELESLLDSLLYEGYALYPYTPGAIKNSTPTPFGIVYPPAYAAGSRATFDRLELRCALRAGPSARLSARLCFLAASGEQHRGERVEVPLAARCLSELSARPHACTSAPPGARGPLLVGLELRARALGDGVWDAHLVVVNRTPCPAGLERSEALLYSLLSTHPLMCVRGGAFVSPLDAPRANVNTFPVLATASDDAVLGAAIALPDHPRLAPESRGALFDSTEIEEALLLHIQALSDAEREQIEHHDPRVREVVARAASAGPSDFAAVHGRVTLGDPSPRRDALTTTPPTEPAGLADPSAGEEQLLVDGLLLRRGDHVRIRARPDADLHARMLDGRSATIGRILVDYDGRTHVGVTIDDDPGQELLADSGRFLFFFVDELEVIGP